MLNIRGIKIKIILILMQLSSAMAPNKIYNKLKNNIVMYYVFYFIILKHYL